MCKRGCRIVPEGTQRAVAGGEGGAGKGVATLSPSVECYCRWGRRSRTHPLIKSFRFDFLDIGHMLYGLQSFPVQSPQFRLKLHVA